MGAIMGHDGEVRMDYPGSTGYGGVVRVAYIDSWTLNPTVDIAEITDYDAGSVSDKEFEYLLRNATFNFSGTLATTAAGSSKGQDHIINMFMSTEPLRKPYFKIQMTSSTADNKVFRGLITGLNIGSNVNDKGTFSADVQITAGIHETS